MIQVPRKPLLIATLHRQMSENQGKISATLQPPRNQPQERFSAEKLLFDLTRRSARHHGTGEESRERKAKGVCLSQQLQRTECAIDDSSFTESARGRGDVSVPLVHVSSIPTDGLWCSLRSTSCGSRSSGSRHSPRFNCSSCIKL